MPEDAQPPTAGPPAERATGPDGAAWLLTGASALPLVLAGLAARTWFAGARDPEFFAYDPATDLTPGVASVSFADRWASFGAAVPFTPALLATALGVAVLAAATLAGRPGWLVPGRGARLVGAAVAALTVVAATALLVAGVVAAGTAPVTTSSGGPFRPSTTADLVGPLGVGLLTGLVAAFACALLVHPPATAPPAAPPAAPPVGTTADPAAGTVRPPAVSEITADPDPSPVDHPDTVPPNDFPRPPPGQLDRYRRS